MKKEYSTADFNTVVLLLALKKKLIRRDKEGRRMTFIFEDDGSVEEIVIGLFNGTVMVNATDLFDEIRKVKSLVMQ